MEDRPTDDGDPPGGASQADGDAGTTEPDIGGIPDGPEAHALALEAEEIRGLVEAGAGTPEAIRELAARLREHRAREESLWKTEVKPSLVKENKGRLRGHRTKQSVAEEERTTFLSNVGGLGLVLLALVGIVVIAANTTVLAILIPFVALLAWAWQQGRRSTD